MRSLMVVLILVVTAGCGQQSPTADSSAGSGSGVIGTGKMADYDFSATTLDGDRLDGASLKGKPVVLWFWAPWCPTCRAQSPTVSELAETYDGRVAMIGVGGLDSEAEIRDLAEQIPHVTHVVDDKGEVWQHFRVTAQSTYTVIDADGEIVHEGYLDNDALEDLVADLAG